MTITVHSTTKTAKLNGIECRIWEGVTERGIPLHCFIARVATKAQGEDAAQFEADLQEQAPPSVEVEFIPLWMIL